MAVLWILNGSPSSRSVSRCASLLRWAWISINPCSKLIRDHHEPRTVIAEDTRRVRVTISWIGTEIAVPLMVVSLLLPTRLLVLLMHLHNLHDRLLHLYVIASRELAAWRVIIIMIVTLYLWLSLYRSIWMIQIIVWWPPDAESSAASNGIL